MFSQIHWLNGYHNACLELVGRYLQEKGMQASFNNGIFGLYSSFKAHLTLLKYLKYSK